MMPVDVLSGRTATIGKCASIALATVSLDRNLASHRGHCNQRKLSWRGPPAIRVIFRSFRPLLDRSSGTNAMA
jgi:hypothetical protein